MDAIQELIACLRTWEPHVCVLGNVRAGEAAEALGTLCNRVVELETMPDGWRVHSLRLEAVEKALLNTAASLAAAISLLERGNKKAAPSDKMFDQMLEDYRKALAGARAVLSLKN